MVLGAAGTGKTTALVEAAVAGMAVDRSLPTVIAFDRGSVRGLRARIAARMSFGSLPQVTTFHALAFALVDRAVAGDESPPRLLSGAEEDVRIRDLLVGAVADGSIEWPDDLLAAVPTLGLANDIRAFLARARERGLTPRDLQRAGEVLGHEAWPALARLTEMDSDVMALEGVIDYTGLLQMAVDFVESDAGRSFAASTIPKLYVDDFQNADPLQRRLVEAIAAAGGRFVVAADPDLSIFAFRGADRLGALTLSESTGAPVVVLDEVHRGGTAVRRALGLVRRQPGLPGLTAEAVRSYREPRSAPDVRPTTVTVGAYDSWGDMAAHVADDLRRRHLGLDGASGLDWADMAILVRSSEHIDALRRALESAGVPVRVATDEIPLRSEPAVAALLAALVSALEPEAMTPEGSADLLLGPLCGLDPAEMRMLARWLRGKSRREHPDAPVPAGIVLVRDLLRDAVRGDVADEPAQGVAAVHRRVTALGDVLRRARLRAVAGARPADVLWLLWSQAQPDADGNSWPERLRVSALAGHRVSGHDLDAVMALFDTAERLSDRYSGVIGVPGFLAALTGQRVPAESVSGRAARVPGVDLLTVHRATARSWDHVVVVGAQEGSWPPVGSRSSVLHVDQVDALARGSRLEGIDPEVLARQAQADSIAEERRLFCLALSRAESGVHVAVVQAQSQTGDQPSRFVDDIEIEPVRYPGRPARTMTLDGLVAHLRTIAQDPRSAPSLRTAAALRLAALAEARHDGGEPIVPSADPRAWWGIGDLSPGSMPVRDPGRPVTLSASGLTALEGCPLRWFLSRAAKAEGPRTRALAFGSIVHVLADQVARGLLPPDPDVLLGHVDRVWAELPFDAEWQSVAEHEALREALARLCAYHRTSDRRVLDTELGFLVQIPLLGETSDGETSDGETSDGEAAVRGAIDRIEVDGEGRVYLIDFKTAASPPSGPKVVIDPQLGLYQAAVLCGALGDEHGVPQIGGASLVQLRVDATRSPGVPRIQEQPPLEADSLADSWILDHVRAAVQRIRFEDFPATVSQECRTCPYTRTCPAQATGAGVIA